MADTPETPPRIIEPIEPRDPDIPMPAPLDPDADVILEESHSPPEDGGVAQHPMHDSDMDDMLPEDFEDEIEGARPNMILPEMKPPVDET
jgi:hypothetical protein